MELTYRPAVADDLEEIFRLVQQAVENMERENIHQWDEVYPAKEDFLGDIRKHNAYVVMAEGRTAAVYVVSREFDEAYKNGDWQYDGEDFYVIHRLCVSPEFQNMGVAGKTLGHIEEGLRACGVKAVRLDVFTENPYALKLYENSGYRRTGTADWRKGRFLLMEKLL